MPDFLTHALAYAADGWRVFPCHTPLFTPDAPVTCSCGVSACATIGKHPRTRQGFQDASSDPTTITRWWTMFPDANIGGIPASAGLVAFDIDSDAAITAARALGLYAEPTFEVRTGNGTHRYYRSAALPTGASIGGIVVRSAHGYVLLPPSRHASGRAYAVQDASAAVDLPPLALAAARHATSGVGARARVQTALTAAHIDAGDRHGALLTLAGSLASSQVPEATATQLVQDANTARCSPPKPSAEVANIVAFAYAKERGKHAEVARHLVIAHTHHRPMLVAAHTPRANPLDAPLPGVLEPMVQWVLATAPQPVRLYGVAAALGFASVVAARRYTTTSANYASLYLLVVGKSGTGKEHVRRCATALLRASDASQLIGANEWTSRSAVWSSVYAQPQSLAIVDEFGQFLGAASGGTDGATMKNGVLTVLMELFGRVDDFAMTPQFATLTLSDKQRKQADRKVVHRPGLSLIGLTTPDEWYDSLKGSRVSNGFVNRFLVLEPAAMRGDLAIGEPIDPPADAVQWARTMLAPRGDLDLVGRVTTLPDAVCLTITPDAHRQFTAFRRECIRRADLLEKERLGELPMRAAEHAMRLALICALARDPCSAVVDADDACWGVSVASYLLAELIPSVQSRVSDSPVHALRNRFLASLREAGERGITTRELARCGVFRGTAKREREETIQWAQEAGHAGWGEIMRAGAGRPRFALTISSIAEQEDAA